jgi:uncharacterized protein
VAARSPRVFTALVVGLVPAAVVTSLAGPATAAPPTAPYVSELHYDNAGADAGEFVEVQLPAGGSSAGLSVVLYNGNNGALYGTLPLPEVTAPGGEPVAVAVDGPSDGIQNGAPDGLALVDDGTVLEFLSYEGTMTATDGPAAGTTSTDIGVSEGSSTPVGQSLSRSYDAEADALVWAGPAAATPGELNPTAEPEPEPGPGSCDLEPTHQVGDVQGREATTPLDGQQVTVRGTVVGDLPGFDGFHLQDPDGDGTADTSDAVFVYSPGAEVDLGDTVAVTGGAGEYGGQTQVTSRNAVEVCEDGTSDDLPEAAPLDLPATDEQRERLEGMLVAPVDELTVSEVYDLTSYGELTLSEGGVLVQPTEVARPGTPAATEVEVRNALRRITLDDGVSARVTPSTRPYLSAETPVRVGDELAFTEPLVLGFGFDQWRLQPADGTADGTFTPQDTRTAAPEQVGGDLQVAAFNVLNYFLTFDQSVGRGAESQEELDRQAAKIVTAINALGAEVVTLMEIEDTDSTGYSPGDADRALADLVRRLNAAAGSEKWAYVPLPQELYAVERDVIRNGIIYQPAAVLPVGEPVAAVDESVWFNAREPIAQPFRSVAEDDVFTVVANHFKSKSPGQPTGDNVDTGDGQGAWNGDRVRQAEALAAFAERLRVGTEDADVLLMGDFNAYSQEDPITTLREEGFVDLGEKLDPGRYSYVFDDMSGSLDHALATRALTRKVTDVTHWNINAVESYAYQYDSGSELYAPHAFRSSDHDPLLLGLDLVAPRPADHRCDGRLPTLLGTNGDDVLRGTNKPDVVHALGGDDVVRGLNGEDVLCGGAGADRLFGGNGDDGLLGGAGDDVLHGDNGSDTLTGGPGDDRLDQGRGKGRVTD